MVKLRRRKRKVGKPTRTQPLRAANVNVRSGANVCKVITKKCVKFFRKNSEVYITNIGDQTRTIGKDVEYYAYSSSDVYVCESGFDFNPRSKIFTRTKTEVKLNPNIKKKYIVVKITTPGHYVIALINQRLKKVEFFNPGGSDHWVTSRTKKMFSEIVPGYKFINLQTQSLQDHDYDGFCQTWIWVWLYCRLHKEWSHQMFKRTFQVLSDEERTELIRDIHYFMIR